MPRLSATGKQALDELLAKTAEERRLPGFVLAVSNVDEQIYIGAGGNKVYGDPTSPPATPESLFWICSMTKLLTAIAALQLIEKGVLSFNTPVSEYFPEFENPVVLQDPFTNPDPSFKPAEKVVTVFHLLTHSSGLYYTLDFTAPHHILPPVYTAVYDSDKKYGQFLEIIKGIYPGIPLLFEPGDAFSYGVSSDILGFVVEKASGQSLEEYSQQHIFSPLGIKNTYHLTADLNKRLIDLCFRNSDNSVSGWEDRAPIIQHYPQPVVQHLGGIGSYSTLPDYLTLLRHLLRIEVGCDVSNAILKPETVKSIFEPKLTPPGAGALQMLVQLSDPTASHLNWSTALAVNTQDWDGRRKAGSAFWSGWAGTWYCLDPKTGIAFVFGSQIVPPMDRVTAEIVQKAEAIIYANLEE